MNAPAVVVPTRAANVVARASAIIGRSICGRWPWSSSRPARSETPTSVPIVSTSAMTKIVSSTPKKPHPNIALKSSLKRIGAGLGGALTHRGGRVATPSANAAAEAMPASLSPMKARNSPIPAAKLKRSPGAPPRLSIAAARDRQQREQQARDEHRPQRRLPAQAQHAHHRVRDEGLLAKRDRKRPVRRKPR